MRGLDLDPPNGEGVVVRKPSRVSQTLDRFHREHATVELAIKDLKAGVGLEHLPSGVFWANSAWFQIAILAHNMMR